MKSHVDDVRRIIAADPRLTGLEVGEEGGELHLLQGDDRFARLLPAEREGVWRMEYFRNRESWECLDFTGSLKECLEFLAENEHYLFWEG